MLSNIFRATMRDAFARAGLLHQVDPGAWERKWTVHVQQIGSGEHAALYLSRYIYHAALTNHRIERFTRTHVTFRYTHARTHETRRLTLPVHAFIGRFLQHILPRGFTKVRSYGLLSPTGRPGLERARALLHLHSDQGRAVPDMAAPAEHDPGSSGAAQLPSARRCPVCRHGHLQFVERYQRSRAPPAT